MGKKLTIKEREERIVHKIVSRIKNIEHFYGTLLTRRGCFRFYNTRGEESRLNREINEKETELNKLRKSQMKL